MPSTGYVKASAPKSFLNFWLLYVAKTLKIISSDDFWISTDLLHGV